MPSSTPALRWSQGAASDRGRALPRRPPMTPLQFAEHYRLRLRRDPSDGTAIIPGRPWQGEAIADGREPRCAYPRVQTRSAPEGGTVN